MQTSRLSQLSAECIHCSQLSLQETLMLFTVLYEACSGLR
jgi:hypothetical protein